MKDVDLKTVLLKDVRQDTLRALKHITEFKLSSNSYKYTVLTNRGHKKRALGSSTNTFLRVTDFVQGQREGIIIKMEPVVDEWRNSHDWKGVESVEVPLHSFESLVQNGDQLVEKVCNAIMGFPTLDGATEPSNIQEYDTPLFGMFS